MTKVVDITPMEKRTPQQVLENAAEEDGLTSAIVILERDDGTMVVDSNGLTIESFLFILEQAKLSLLMGAFRD